VLPEHHLSLVSVTCSCLILRHSHRAIRSTSEAKYSVDQHRRVLSSPAPRKLVGLARWYLCDCRNT
jgi:hypothetical protein